MTNFIDKNVKKQNPLTVILFSFLFLSTILFSGEVIVEEEDVNLCEERGTVVGFFNGVQTTKRQAKIAKYHLSIVFGEKTEEDELIKYELLYNYTKGFEDFVETFEQRLKEQNNILKNRFELFFQILHQKGTWWDSIINAVPELTSLLGAISDDMQASAVHALSSMVATASPISTYVEHQTRIDSFILEGRKLLYFAHSQGNLFANVAYDYTVLKVGSKSVKVVHVAPASPTLRGHHTLADKDLVINGLRIAGSVPDITDDMPPYLHRSAGINGYTDILGHGLLEIYLNKNLPMFSRIKSHFYNGIATLEVPEVEASAGFFTATLTWDGVGDVDLHVFEPRIRGEHVYYSNKTGVAGSLDVDNTSSFGPEHYYASCNQAKLLEGNYGIGLANYKNANGRKATIQIASWKKGVLSTESVILGNATGDKPECPMFFVQVVRNEAGKLHVKLQDVGLCTYK